MKYRYRSVHDCDYPPEWDEPDEDVDIDEDDFVEPDEGYLTSDDINRLTDLEIRYNRDY